MAISSGTRSLLRELTAWVAAAALLICGFVYYDDLRHMMAAALGVAPHATVAVASAAPEQQRRAGMVELAAHADGHFYATAEANGRAIAVLVDTGATMVALTYEDAERAGVRLAPSDFTQRVSTANGTARFALVRLDRVSVGGITVRDVPAGVAERGRLTTSLLGMSFLSRLERVDMGAGKLILTD